MPALRCVTVHGLAGSGNCEKGILETLREAEDTLHPGLKLTGPDVEFIVGACDPEKGGEYVDRKTEVKLGDKVLQVFKKVHVLPYKDTFRYNYDFMYLNHVVPYFNGSQQGEFTTGYEFAIDGVRFQVVGVQPEGSYGVVGASTEVFYEGPPLERQVLERLHMLPFEEGLPDRYRISKLQLDDAGLVRDFVRPYFEQKSRTVTLGETIEISGVNFKVVGCRPSAGGGVGKDTELVCQGVALKPASALQNRTSASGAAKAKAKASKGKGKGKGYPVGSTDAAAAAGSEGQICLIS